MNLLPGVDDAVIPADKLTRYSLDSDRQPDKATAFRRALGYTSDNADVLIADIKCNLHCYPAISKGHNGWGETYDIILNLCGPNGKNANVLTAWIVRDGETFPRLTNVYVTEKRLR